MNITHLSNVRSIYVLFLLTFFLLFSVPDVSSMETGPAVGKLAPSFELKDMKGDQVKFDKFKGKVILLNFWATWCGPCRKEMPAMHTLYSAYKDRGFVVLAISIDPSVKPVRKFIKKKKLTFPVLMDSDKEIYFDHYAVFTLPMSFLIDRNGVIVEKYFGEKEWDSKEMKSKVLTLLEKK